MGLLVHLALTLLLPQGANPVGQVSKRPVTAGNAFKTSMLELVAHLEAKVEERGVHLLSCRPSAVPGLVAHQSGQESRLYR